MTPVKMHTLLLYRRMYITNLNVTAELPTTGEVHVCGFLSYYLTIINVCQCLNLLCDSPSLAVTIWSHCWAVTVWSHCWAVTIWSHCWAAGDCDFETFYQYKAQLATPTPPTWSCSTALMGVTTLVKKVDTPVKMHAVKHTYLLYRCISSSLSSLLWWLPSSWSSCWWWLWSSVPTSEKSPRERRGACISSLSFRTMEIYNYSKW